MIHCHDILTGENMNPVLKQLLVERTAKLTNEVLSKPSPRRLRHYTAWSAAVSLIANETKLQGWLVNNLLKENTLHVFWATVEGYIVVTDNENVVDSIPMIYQKYAWYRKRMRKNGK